jgi:hypothetical protein
MFLTVFQSSNSSVITVPVLVSFLQANDGWGEVVVAL